MYSINEINDCKSLVKLMCSLIIRLRVEVVSARTATQNISSADAKNNQLLLSLSGIHLCSTHIIPKSSQNDKWLHHVFPNTFLTKRSQLPSSWSISSEHGANRVSPGAGDRPIAISLVTWVCQLVCNPRRAITATHVF